MTWVVATNSIFGAAYVVGDTRVTWRDRPEQTLDTQKVHVVGNYVVAGFSGSVACGFAAVEVLRYELSKLEVGTAWDLPIIANTWLPRAMRRTFMLQSEVSRSAGMSLLVAATDPDRGNGLPGRLRTWVCRMNGPEFGPTMTDRPDTLEIGTGSREYGAALLGFSSSNDFHLSASGAPFRIQATVLAGIMHETRKHRPVSTVGGHFHIGIVEGPNAEVGQFGHLEYPPEGPPQHDAFPTCANWPAFLEVCAERGWVAAEACDSPTEPAP